MPSTTEVHRWLVDPAKSEFWTAYARAREAQAEHYADQVIEIADGTKAATRHVQVEAARTQIDARKWLASKLKPKSFGDKVQTDITIHKPAQELSDDELAALAGAGSRRATDPA